MQITCPVCGRVPADRRAIGVVEFFVPDEANEGESSFADFAEAKREADELGVDVELGLSDGCRTTNLGLVGFAP